MNYPYSTQQYAQSFSDSVTPLRLRHTNTWVLKQPIYNSGFYDIKTCYPRYAISENTLELQQDFSELEQTDLISFTAPTDVFHSPAPSQLQTIFDHVTPFKTHYIINYDLPINISKHHQYEIRQAKKNCLVEMVSLKKHFLQWLELYNFLADRHAIDSAAKFTAQHFETLMQLENLISVAAFNKTGEIIAMHLWLQDNQYTYSHLAASSDKGYSLRASYAIYAYVIDYFHNKKLAIDLGSCAGTLDDANNGLAQFKRGFSNDTKMSYLCGKIFDQHTYHILIDKTVSMNKNFFPLYRYHE